MSSLTWGQFLLSGAPASSLLLLYSCQASVLQLSGSQAIGIPIFLSHQPQSRVWLRGAGQKNLREDFLASGSRIWSVLLFLSIKTL